MNISIKKMIVSGLDAIFGGDSRPRFRELVLPPHDTVMHSVSRSNFEQQAFKRNKKRGW